MNALAGITIIRLTQYHSNLENPARRYGLVTLSKSVSMKDLVMVITKIFVVCMRIYGKSAGPFSYNEKSVIKALPLYQKLTVACLPRSLGCQDSIGWGGEGCVWVGWGGEWGKCWLYLGMQVSACETGHYILIVFVVMSPEEGLYIVERPLYFNDTRPNKY